ncbi:proline-rich receptor-like protein kinase PERK2 [Morone saxatilis]|uniref:proline-rich receptor-like protein kinase PERK2 n=1 Tax=Morone saxatilis TaxID=34816 RepID=UPI0015E20D6E|nr:proline-rich receptor-like protein kinase PERK2 [Morone saxatilis]
MLQTPSPFFPTLTPTPPPTPLATTTALQGRPFSSRRSPSYESSISLKDLAPPAPFEPTQFNFLSRPPQCLIAQCSHADPHQSPAFPYSPHPSSPIPLITSPLPPSSAANSPPPIPSSLTPVPSSPTSAPASPILTTPKSSQAERNTFSCHTPSKTATTSTNLTPVPSSIANQSESITLPVSPIPSSPSGRTSPSVIASPSKDSVVTQGLASSSRPVSPLSLSTLPPISPSGSRCPSPSPSSPPLRSLSPCPACQCTCAPSVPPPPTQTHTDPSTMEILM